MRSASAKPAVVTSAVRAPRRSSRALVARVVPRRTRTEPSGSWRRWASSHLIPATGASSPLASSPRIPGVGGPGRGASNSSVPVAGSKCFAFRSTLSPPGHRQVKRQPSKYPLGARRSVLSCQQLAGPAAVQEVGVRPVLSSLWVTKLPSGRRATQSVNVPPTSIQKCQSEALSSIGNRGGKKRTPATFR